MQWQRLVGLWRDSIFLFHDREGSLRGIFAHVDVLEMLREHAVDQGQWVDRILPN